MSAAPGTIPAELLRYREMLEPLAALPADGSAALPPEERAGWDAALATLRGYHGDHLELEEAVAGFARALWAAPAWGEPPARIAEALVARSRHWPEGARREALALARRFADRALAADRGSPAVRLAFARVRLAAGDLEEAERMSLLLAPEDPAALALRSELAEARGDRDEAVRLRERQIALDEDAARLREARNKLGLLLQAQGRLDEAIACHRENLARHPEYSWGRVNLGSALEAKGELLEAFAEVEGAVATGVAEARPFLDALAAELDRRTLERFRRLLRTARDGEPVELAPSPAGAQ